MKLSFDYKGIKVTYYLTYKKAKAISIKVTDEGRVNVVAPIGTTVFAVMDKVKGNAPWIISELYGKVQQEAKATLLEQYTYLGKNYKLELALDPSVEKAKVKMLRGKFVVETATEEPSEVRKAIVEWYSQKVPAKIKERIKEYKDLFEVVPSKIEVAEEGNMLFKGTKEGIVADVRVGILSVDVIDFIIVSTLCHINTTNEKDKLKRLEEILPNYAKSEAWLEENKNQLAL